MRDIKISIGRITFDISKLFSYILGRCFDNIMRRLIVIEGNDILRICRGTGITRSHDIIKISRRLSKSQFGLGQVILIDDIS